MKKEKNLDELFRDKLLNYEKEPPSYLLENILSSVSGARRRRKLVYWRVAGVAAALLIAFVAGWQLNDSAIQKTNQVVTAVRPSTPEKSSEANQVEKIMPANQSAPAKSQLASTETNSSIRNNQLKSITQSLKVATIVLAAGPVVVASNDETLLMKPLKSLDRLIYLKTENSTALQDKKSGDDSSGLTQKSIDQQIMEQNKQMLTVENKSKEKTRWLVGAQVSPEYNVSRGSQSQAYASNMLRSSSSNQVDLGGGISVEFKKGKRWSLQSGVYYSGLGQASGNTSSSGSNDLLYANAGSNYFNTPVKVDAISNRMSLNSNAGVIELSKIPSGLVVGNSLEANALNSTVIVSPTSFIQNFDYIEIPLYVRYTLIDARFDVVMLGGLSSNVLVGNQIFVEGASGKSLVGKTNDMQTLNYSGTLGMGIKYGLSKHISLNVEPRIKYYLNSLNSNSSVTYKPYTIGVFTGLSYEF